MPYGTLITEIDASTAKFDAKLKSVDTDLANRANKTYYAKMGLDASGVAAGVRGVNKMLDGIQKHKAVLELAVVGDDKMRGALAAIETKTRTTRQAVDSDIASGKRMLQEMDKEVAAMAAAEAKYFRDLDANISKATSNTAQFQRQIDATTNLTNKANLSNARTFAEVEAAEQKAAAGIKNIGNEAKAAKGAASELSGAFKGILLYQGVSMITGAIGGAVSGAFKAGIDYNAQLETNLISTERLLKGDTAAAKDLQAQLEKFAIITPFKFEDLLPLESQLIAAKKAAGETNAEIRKNLIPTMTAIGDAASGLNRGQEGVEHLTLAFAQATAGGKITGETLKEMRHVGVPAIKYLADAWGTTTAKMTEYVSKGMVGAKKGQEAILYGMERDFGGMMERQSKTYEGSLNNLADIGKKRAGTVFKPVFDDLRALVDALYKWGQSKDAEVWANNAATAFDSFGKNVNTAIDAIDRLTGIGSSWDEAMKNLKTGWTALRDTMGDIAEANSRNLSLSQLYAERYGQQAAARNFNRYVQSHQAGPPTPHYTDLSKITMGPPLPPGYRPPPHYGTGDFDAPRHPAHGHAHHARKLKELKERDEYLKPFDIKHLPHLVTNDMALPAANQTIPNALDVLSGGLKISTAEIMQGRNSYLAWQKEIGSPGAISSLTAYLDLQKKLNHILNENAAATSKAVVAEGDRLAVLKVQEPMLEAVMKSDIVLTHTRQENAALEAKRRELWHSSEIRGMLDQADTLQGQHRYSDAARLRTQANVNVQTQLAAFGTNQQAERAAAYVATVRKEIDKLSDSYHAAMEAGGKLWDKALHPYTAKQLQDAVKTWTTADAKADRLFSDAVSKYNQQQTADKVRQLAAADAASFGATGAVFGNYGHYQEQLQELQAQLAIRQLPASQREGATRWRELQQDDRLTDNQRKDIFDVEAKMRDMDRLDDRLQQKAGVIKDIFTDTFSHLSGGIKGMLTTLEEDVTRTLQNIAVEIAVQYTLKKLFGLNSDSQGGGSGGYSGGNGWFSKIGNILDSTLGGGGSRLGYDPGMSAGDYGGSPFSGATAGADAGISANSVAHNHGHTINITVHGGGDAATIKKHVRDGIHEALGSGMQSSQMTQHSRVRKGLRVV